jgi:hypothetical protein
MSPWIQHVKNFAKAKGMKYNEALKSSDGVRRKFSKDSIIVPVDELQGTSVPGELMSGCGERVIE